jgi:hypothetical protein
MTLGGTVTSVTGLTSLTATTIVGSLSGTATTATNIAGGAIGAIPYQSAAGTTAILSGNTSSTVMYLTSSGNGTVSTAPSWVAPSFVPYTGATRAVNLGSYDMTVNGLTVGRGGNGVSVTNANTTFGISALSSSSTSGSGANTAIGNNVLTSNTSGSKNTGLGYFALNANVTGTENTAVGYYALTANNSSSSENTAIGSNAMFSNTSGIDNTAVGSKSLYKNSTGRQNSILGTLAYFNGEGSYNTAVGYRALMSPSAAGNTGEFNVSMGYYSGSLITTGSQNLFLGSNAGYSISTGNKNIFIGYNAGSSISSGSTANTTGLNSVLIGHDVRPAADGETNQIVIAGYTGTGVGQIGLGTNSTLIGNTSTQQSRIYGALTVTANTAAANMTGTSSTIAAQNATTATYGGGDLNLTAGNAGTTGLGGNIVLTPGTSTTAANNGIVRVNGQVQITGGSPGAGEVLMSDANGLATWSYSIGSTVVTSTTTYAITLAEAYVFYTGSVDGAFTIPDPSSSNAGKEITIKNKTGFVITITPTSTGKIYIDSANTAANNVRIGIEASNNWIKLVSDGSQWNVFRALF